MLRFTVACAVGLLLSPLVASAQSTDAEMIRNALSAAPEHIAAAAAVWASPPLEGEEPQVLREGTNGWTCFPSSPNSPGNDPRCADLVFLQFVLAIRRGQSADLSGVGLGYMLQGGGSVDERGVQTLGPHTMMVLPAPGPLAESIRSETPEGTFVFDVVDGAALVVMPVAAGGETIR